MLQNISFLSSLLKRIDRLLQFDRWVLVYDLIVGAYFIFRHYKITGLFILFLNPCNSLMPSYNGILTISCIRTLAQIALKMSSYVPLVSNLYSSIVSKIYITFSNSSSSYINSNNDKENSGYYLYTTGTCFRTHQTIL